MSLIITVNFRGADLYGFENDEGRFVALKPMVEAMGLDWSSQLKRLKRDPILSEGMAIMTIPFGRGGAQEMACVKLELVNGWLMTIDVHSITDAEVRDRVLVYKRECYRVLAEHFASGRPTPAEIPDEEQTHEPDGVRVRLVSEARQVFGARAAGELWFKLGLPIVPAMTERRRQMDLLGYSRIRTDGDDDEGRAA